jgi:hypothetical protein
MKRTEILIKTALFGLSIVLALICLHGCVLDLGLGGGGILPPGSDFKVTLSPPSGHPRVDSPFTVEIQATDMGGGTYTYKGTGKDTVSIPWDRGGDRYSMVVSTWPWKCEVTWTDGLGGFEEAEEAIALVNTAPVINWPRVDGIDPHYNGCILHEVVRYIFDLNFYQTEALWPGDQVQRFGIFDPEGDDWKIVKVEVLWYGRGFPSGREVTVYTPPYEPGVYHTTRYIGRSEILPNSFILYPPYKARWDEEAERWTCPTAEWTYRPLRAWCNEGLDTPTSPSAPLTVLIGAEDEYGAYSERLFDFTMDATGCNVSSLECGI